MPSCMPFPSEPGHGKELALKLLKLAMKETWEQLRKPLAGCGGKGLPEQDDMSNL